MTETAAPTIGREAPWFKIGRLTDEPATAKEAAAASGLDFDVQLCPAGFQKPDGSWVTVPHRQAVSRVGDDTFMSFVSSGAYNMLQYGEAFNFMDTIAPKYVAAGQLRGGRQGFMVVKTELKLNVLGNEDPHDMYGILRTSHDCSRAIELSMMPLRLRCTNQLTLRTFSKHSDYRWSIKHTSTMHAKLAEAQESLEKIGLYIARYEENVERLATKTLHHEQARKFLEIVIPKPKGKTERVEQQHAERLTAILNLWSTSPTVAYAGTGWGLVNAVSEYWDWYRPGGTPESRFLNALEGETHKKVNKLAGLILSGAA